jgi:hypothetical protein
VQTIIQTFNMALAPSAPSREALRKQVKRVHREDGLVEPYTLDNINLPAQYLVTNNGDQFC